MTNDDNIPTVLTENMRRIETFQEPATLELSEGLDGIAQELARVADELRSSQGELGITGEAGENAVEVFSRVERWARHRSGEVWEVSSAVEHARSGADTAMRTYEDTIQRYEQDRASGNYDEFDTFRYNAHASNSLWDLEDTVQEAVEMMPEITAGGEPWREDAGGLARARTANGPSVIPPPPEEGMAIAQRTPPPEVTGVPAYRSLPPEPEMHRIIATPRPGRTPDTQIPERDLPGHGAPILFGDQPRDTFPRPGGPSWGPPDTQIPEADGPFLRDPSVDAAPPPGAGGPGSGGPGTGGPGAGAPGTTAPPVAGGPGTGAPGAGGPGAPGAGGPGGGGSVGVAPGGVAGSGGPGGGAVAPIGGVAGAPGAGGGRSGGTTPPQPRTLAGPAGSGTGTGTGVVGAGPGGSSGSSSSTGAGAGGRGPMMGGMPMGGMAGGRGSGKRKKRKDGEDPAEELEATPQEEPQRPTVIARPAGAYGGDRTDSRPAPDELRKGDDQRTDEW
ncbi:hypothetical protein ACPYO6_04120 [Georgenia sp. Z1344]|uniref:hypothetical protein n=1 Tax=Georgenia sp. Z1344 TaxID=3416706 RepID=UPI003CEE57A1